MFEYMGDRLNNAIKNIKGMGRITEENISDAIKEIRMALLEADVNYEVVKEFTKNVKEKALGLEVGNNLKPEEVLQENDGNSKMILLEPRAYSESQQIADHLKSRHTVVVNLKRVTPDQAKRIVDFLSGTIYALQGDLQKIGKGRAP